MGLIRFYLALIVAGDHFTGNNLYFLNLFHHGGMQYWFYMNAGFAVMLFYVISGFLISFVLDAKYHDDIFGFYRARFVRIFGLYWPMLAICIAIFPVGNSINWFSTLFLVGGDWLLSFRDYPRELTPFPGTIGQAWSLAAEVTFYALAPWLLRRRVVCFVTFVSSLTLRVLLEHHSNAQQVWGYHFFPTALCFFLGGHYARVLWSKFPKPSMLATLALTVGSFVCAGFATRIGGMPSVWFYGAVAFFILALGGIFTYTRDLRWMNFLGDLAYPIYLSHMMLVSAFAPFGPIPIANVSNLTRTGIFLVVASFAGLAAHLVIEKPINFLLRGRRVSPVLQVTPLFLHARASDRRAEDDAPTVG